MGCFRLLGFRSSSQQNAIEVGFAITGSDEPLLYLKRPRTGPEAPLAVTVGSNFRLLAVLTASSSQGGT